MVYFPIALPCCCYAKKTKKHSLQSTDTGGEKLVQSIDEKYIIINNDFDCCVGCLLDDEMKREISA